MNEGPVEYLESDLLKDAEATNQRAALSPEGDELTTTVRPPLTPPPPAPTASMPPLPSFPPPTPPPTFGNGHSHAYAHAPAAMRPEARSEGDPFPATKPSWLGALLKSTFPPPAERGAAPADAPISARTAGTIFASLGLVFAVVALVTGMRGAPTEAGIAPVVAAALVLARALVAVGAGALSFAMFLRAERLLVRS